MDNKDLISQYVDTGLGIPEYQFMQLSNNDKKTYLRKRLIAAKQYYNIDKYEIDIMDDTQKFEVINLIETILINKNRRLKSYEFDIIPDDLKVKYVISQAKKIIYGYDPNKLDKLSKPMFDYLPSIFLTNYLEKLVSLGSFWLDEYEFSLLSPVDKFKYIENSINKGKMLDDLDLKYATDNQKMKYFKNWLNNGGQISLANKEWYENKLKNNGQ